MKNDDLLTHAKACKLQGLDRMTVWTPQGWKAPKGFPRRELLCIPTEGGKTWSVSTDRLLAWLEAAL